MLTSEQKASLTDFCRLLIDQRRARVVVPPLRNAPGFWFGGGNLTQGPDGALYLSGRYRNYGDSRTGLAVGERGLKLVILRSEDGGANFGEILSLTKSELGPPGRPVLSIEGTALRFGDAQVELFVSSEKMNIGYPADLGEFLKPGAGVWTIERLAAGSIAALAQAPIETVLETQDPRFLHVKDPFLYEATDGRTLLGFCTHPYSWTSSNSAVAARSATGSAFGEPDYTFFPRGQTWDVAMSRVTAFLRVPRVGQFVDLPPQVLMFYDGGECIRNLDEHAAAVARPRGYSCEELGGVAVAPESDLRRGERLSRDLPLFVSPYGTGCSRYVDVLATDAGFYAVWQQSQPDQTQPLVMNYVDRADAEALLT